MKSRRQVFGMAALAGAGALVGRKPSPTPAAVPATRPMVKPKALKPGDTVGLITPSSYVFDTWRIDLAAARLEASLGSGLGLDAIRRHIGEVAELCRRARTATPAAGERA